LVAFAPCRELLEPRFRVLRFLVVLELEELEELEEFEELEELEELDEPSICFALAFALAGPSFAIFRHTAAGTSA